MNRIVLLILGLLGCFCTLQAQIPNTRDSLVLYLKNPPKDSNYVWALNRYANKLINETAEYEKADSILKIAEPLALKYNYPLGKYANTRNRALIHYYKTEYSTALRFFQQCITEAESFTSLHKLFMRHIVMSLLFKIVYPSMKKRSKLRYTASKFKKKIT